VWISSGSSRCSRRLGSSGVPTYVRAPQRRQGPNPTGRLVMPDTFLIPPTGTGDRAAYAADRNKESVMAKAPKPPDLTGIVTLADEEAVKEILSTSIMGLWEVVNTLTRLRPSKRERYRVAIFGSARAKPGSFVYEEVKRAAA